MSNKILLVEDEALIALNEAKLLEKHDYHVVTVYTGKKAVETAVNDPEIDLILMDIDLGSGMDGTEAASQILEQRELPVVFLTSHAEKEMVDRVKNITRYGYVLKNSGKFVLIESINMAFELFEARLKSREKEAELEEANKLKRLILDSTSELFAFYDTNLTIKWANRAAADSVGRNPKELLGEHCYEVWHQRGEPCEECPLLSVLETGEPQEKEQITPDGREWLLRGYPVIERGEITGLVEFGQDVTPKREAERGMLNNEERYRILYNNISDAIILVDTDRNITHCNPAFTETFGYTLEEVRGEPTSLLFADVEEYRRLGKAMKEHRGEKHFRYTLRYTRKNGEEFKGEKSVHYLRGSRGEVTGFIGVIREVSEQKFSEEQLRESERQYRKLYHSIRDAIVVVDENRAITHCNPAFIDLFGYTLDEIRGRSTAFLFENEEEFEKLGERMADSSREQNFYSTVRYRRKNGEVFVGEKNIHFLRDGSGRMKGFIGVIRDITERIRSEEKVQQLLSEKQMLLREVHHRIKNDMNSISSLLSLQSASLTNPEAVNALEEAQNRISLMSNIYDTLYKAEGYREIPIHDFLETIIENIRCSYEGFSNISIETDFEEITVPAKQAFPIGIIVNELIANAYKYAFSGVEQGHICTKLYQRDDGYLEIRVEDNGVGFPAEVTRDGHYGFGLTLVEAFSQQYGGNFRIEQNETNVICASLKISE